MSITWAPLELRKASNLRREVDEACKRFNEAIETGNKALEKELRRAFAERIDQLEDFYLRGMNATLTLAADDESAGVSSRCFLWDASGVDVCFVSRPDRATRGGFKVRDMEAMLHAVAHKLLQNPNCGRNKWEDNHYAYDAQTRNADFVLDWLEANPHTRYVCNGRSVHYVFDPTGWCAGPDAAGGGRRRARRRAAAALSPSPAATRPRSLSLSESSSSSC